jgi:hypothetical protein
MAGRDQLSGEGRPTITMNWFEARFNEEQQIGWKKAEAEMGIKAKAKKRKNEEKEKGNDEPLQFLEGFAQYDLFRGSFLNWAFKLGNRGQGYYQEGNDSDVHNKREGQVVAENRENMGASAHEDKPGSELEGIPSETASCSKRADQKRNADGIRIRQ